jgi:hypothetical protein
MALSSHSLSHQLPVTNKEFKMQQTLGSSTEDILSPPIRGGRSLTTLQKKNLDLSQSIQGWGSDLDPKVRPGVPMDKAPQIGIETLYPDFEMQIPTRKVHKSTEHGKMTPVFGAVCPPRLLSGRIRDIAYKMSEGKLSHWLLLVAADRIDMIEELFLDVAKLDIPNIPHEMGLASEWKYNRQQVIKKAAIVTGVSIAAFIVIKGLRKNRGSYAQRR